MDWGRVACRRCSSTGAMVTSLRIDEASLRRRKFALNGVAIVVIDLEMNAFWSNIVLYSSTIRGENLVVHDHRQIPQDEFETNGCIRAA